jgi:hypothetical protein
MESEYTYVHHRSHWYMNVGTEMNHWIFLHLVDRGFLKTKIR